MSVTFSKFIMLDTLRWLHPRDKFRGHSNVTPYTYRSNEVVQVNRGIEVPIGIAPGSFTRAFKENIARLLWTPCLRVSLANYHDKVIIVGRRRPQRRNPRKWGQWSPSRKEQRSRGQKWRKKLKQSELFWCFLAECNKMDIISYAVGVTFEGFFCLPWLIFCPHTQLGTILATGGSIKTKDALV